MDRQQREAIEVRAFVTVGEQEICVEELNEEQKRTLSLWLRSTYFGELFRAEAVFHAAEEK